MPVSSASPRASNRIVVSSSDLPEVTLSTEQDRPEWLVDPTLEASLRAYADILSTTGVERGLIGPREVDRIWDRHILNCAVVTECVPRGTQVVDVGSGAGLPGLVWALARPDLTVTLVEPLLRRSTFLDEIVESLAIGDRVTVVRGRAEDVVGQVHGAVTTARAVAPLERLLGWTLPLTEAGGELLALKGRSAADEIAQARQTLADFDVDTVEILDVGAGIVDPPTRVVRVALPAARGDSRDVLE